MAEANVRTKYWPQVAIALISTIGTIGVAWIGVIPSIRQSDQAEIQRLEGNISRLGERLSVLDPYHASTESWVIKGAIADRDGGGGLPVRNAFVALLPLGNQNLQAISDDQGQFVISGVPTGHYFLLVNPEGKTLDRGTIEARENGGAEIPFEARTVTYQIGREGQE